MSKQQSVVVLVKNCLHIIWGYFLNKFYSYTITSYLVCLQSKLCNALLLPEKLENCFFDVKQAPVHKYLKFYDTAIKNLFFCPELMVQLVNIPTTSRNECIYSAFNSFIL